MTHRLLDRQLKKSGLERGVSPTLEKWLEFLALVENTYKETDQDRYLMERSLAISSEEMQALFDELKTISEMRYQNIFEGVQDAIIVEEWGAKILDANSRACEMFNRTLTEFNSLSFADLLPADALEEIHHHLQQSGFLSQPIETVAQRSGGDEFPIEVSVRVQEIGPSRALIAVLRDISERKKAEQTIQESEIRYQAIVEDQTEFINRFLPDGTVTFVNQAYAALHGMTQEELIGSPQSTFMEDQYIEQIRKITSSLSRDNPVTTSEHKFRKMNGEVIWLHWTDRVILDEAGNPMEYQGVGRDITLRKQAEERLKFTQFAVDRAADTAYWVGPDAHFLYVNDAACSSLGYSKDELLSMTIQEIDPDFSVDGWRERWDEIQQISSSTMEMYHRRKNGDIFPVEITSNYVEFGGQAYICAFVRDITKRKEEEQQREKTAAELAILNEIAGRISSVLHLESVLSRAVQLVHSSFGHPHVSIFLINETSQRLEMAAIAGEYIDIFQPDHYLSVGEGIVGQVAKKGESVLVNDVSSDPNYVNRYPDRIQTKAELSVPIMVNDRVLGVLDIQSGKVNAFDKRDVLVMETLVEQLAAAITNARLHADAQRALIEQTALREAGLALLADLEIETVLSRIAEQMCKAVDATSAYICNWDEKSRTMTVIADHTTANASKQEAISDLGKRYVEKDDPDFLSRMQSNTPDSVHVDDPDLSETDRAHMLKYGGKSILYIPILMQGKLVAVAEVWESRTKRDFISDEINLLQGISQQAALALKNAQLFDTVQSELKVRQEIQDQVRLLASALESAANAIVITDPDGKIIWANQAFGSLTGYLPEEVYGQTMKFLHSGEQTRDFYQQMWKTIIKGEIWQGELVNQRKDGSHYFEEQTITPVRDTGGVISHFIAIKNDITLRKQNEKYIRQQADDLSMMISISEMISQGADLKEIIGFLAAETKKVFSGNGATMYLVSDDYRYLMSQNLTISKSTLRKIEKLVGSSFFPYRLDLEMNTIYREVLRTCEARVVNGEAGVRKVLDDIIRAADLHTGVLRSVMEKIAPQIFRIIDIHAVSIVPLVSQGEPIGILELSRAEPFSQEDTDRLQAIATQLTAAIEKRQAQEALKRSEENYRTIFEGVQDAIFVESLHGDILDVNQRACEMYGYSREDFLLLKVRDIVPEGQKIVLPTEVTTGEQSDQVFETENIRADGERFPVQITARLQAIGGRQLMLAVVRDISDLYEARKHSELQERLAAVGQLAAGIAHDFNNILGTIILYSELILNNELLMPDDRDRLATIFQQAQRGAKLTAQVLDFSRRSVMERHTLDLGPFMEDMDTLLSRTLPENVNLIFSYDVDQSYVVNADPARMQQVVMNLVLNARDAMPDGGELHLHLQRIDVASEEAVYRDMKPGAWIRIQIEDTGVGIPSDALPHIFEPFFTTKPQGEGTGLGLAQVYGIVKQHEGYIDARSVDGEGTCFTIHLPAIPEEMAVEISTSVSDPHGGAGETILVVEDDEATRLAIGEILKSLGYNVVQFANGEQALNYLKGDGSVDLIISDLVMPHMGGRELYDQVNQDFPDVKIMLMTGYPLGTGTRELLDLRRVRWLQKPLDSKTIANAVQSLLE
jgi:PAS domain S-box-containing protein